MAREVRPSRAFTITKGSRLMKAIRLLLAGVVVAFSGTAQASLIGDTVTCSFSASLTCSPSSAVVTPVPEFTLTNSLIPFFTIDIGGSSVAINRVGAGCFFLH